MLSRVQRAIIGFATTGVAAAALSLLVGFTVVDVNEGGVVAASVWPAVLWAAIAGAAVTVLSALVTRWRVTTKDMAIFHLLCWHLAILPLGLGVLAAAFSGTAEPAWPLTLLAWLSPAPALIFAYATLIEPYWIEDVTLDLPVLPAGSPEVRLVVVADLETDRVTAFQRRIADHVTRLRPDVVLLPGDLFDGLPENLARNRADFRRYLEALVSRHDCLASLGNADDDWAVALIPQTGVHLLDNAVAVRSFGAVRVGFAGLTEPYDASAAADALRELSNADVAARIVLAHHPEGVRDYPPAVRTDLTLSGHTHGGQVVVPGFGPPMTQSTMPRHVSAGGLHWVQIGADGATRAARVHRRSGRIRVELPKPEAASSSDEHLLYVSRGVGYERGWAPSIRFLCRPEVTLVRLVERV